MIFLDTPNYQLFNINYRLQADNWKEAACTICEKHNIAFTQFKPYTDGSNLVASINEDMIIKIFPPFHSHQWDSEYKVLSYLHGKLTTNIPALIAFGSYEHQWTYVIITKVAGQSLETVWSNCTYNNKLSILSKIGVLMKEVHSLEIASLSELKPEWNVFIKDQLFKYKERHARNGMPEWFLTHVDEYVNTNIGLLPSNPELVILTGEYTPFNLKVEGKGTKWNVTGMIDFGDAMIGYNEYDFLGPLLFLCEGNKQMVQTLLIAYGYTEQDFNISFRKRLLLLSILHRYSNFKEQIRIPGWQDRVRNFDELEQVIWPI